MVTAAADAVELQDDAEACAAESNKANQQELDGADGAGDAGNGKRSSAAAAKPRALTDMEKEQALAAQFRSIEDEAIALQHHDPTTPEYLVQVARVHCVDPAFRVFYSAIFTMFHCRGRSQAALETAIHGIFTIVDQDKRTEFRSFITQLHGRLPPRSKPEPKVPVETYAHFGKLLNTLASAKVEQNDATGALIEIDEFVVGTVQVVRTHGAELQKKRNFQVYDYRATAGFHLFHSGKLLVEVPDSTPSRMVKYLGDAYYLTR